MLPNKTVATLFVGLLLLEICAGFASAQQIPDTPAPDLVITSIDVGGADRIAGIPLRINITVKNIGDAPFLSTSGWQIFVGLNGLTTNDCIESGDGSNVGSSTQEKLRPCYIRMLPGDTADPDGTNKTSLDANGDSGVYVLMWNAENEQVNASARIHAEIGGFGNDPGLAQGTNCQGPDAPACGNNQFIERGVSIGRLGVRARPIRDNATNVVDPDENYPWQESDIRGDEICPTEPLVVMRGCRVPAGKTIVAKFLIINSGTVDDIYTPSLPDSVATWERRGYAFAFAPHNVSVEKNSQKEVALTISVPENATSGESLNVNLTTHHAQWTSKRASFITTANPNNPYCSGSDRGITRYCVNPTLPSFIVAPRYGFNATSNETWKEVVAGRSVRFNISINNTGNTPDEFNVSFVNSSWTINPGWFPTVHDAGGIWQANETRNVSVEVKPIANNATDNATNTSYHFDIAIKSKRDPSGKAPCKANLQNAIDTCTMRFTAHVAHTYDMFGIPDVPIRTVPGETFTYNLGIENKGNGYDNVSLDLASTVGGWDVRLSDRVAHLTPFNTTTFTLTVTSPPNVPENTVAEFYVNATANGPDTTPFDQRAKAEIASRMTILRGPNMRVSTPLNSSFVDPGTSVTYDVHVVNVGNVADNFTIPNPLRPSDWGVEVSPPSLELQPNQEGLARVTLTAPSSAAVGEKANAIVTVRSSVDTSRVKTLTLEGRVSGPDLFVDNVVVNSTNPYSGDPLEVSVVLGNNGNKGADQNSTLRLYYVQNGVERVIGEKTYAPNAIPGQRRLTETFVWDTTGVEGVGVLLARIDVDSTVAEIDESAASNEKTRALTLRTFDIKLTPAQGLSARPGEKVTYGESPNVVLVEYRGNQPSEPVTIRFESEHGWLSSQSELSLALPRGTPIPIIASIEVPSRPGAGKDALTITVVPALRQTEALRATMFTTIIDEEKPIVSRITVTPATARLGDLVSLDAYIEDATGVSSATAYVTLPTNETSAVVLQKVAEGRWNATKAWTVAGAYSVRVEAADEADPPNFNKTRATSASFTITPGSAPTIKLAADQSASVRAGTPVRLEIRDPLGIGKASYSIKGVSYELKGPDFVIDTSTFAEGPVDITVTAENIYGVASTQRIALTVDNAAPGITKVTMKPERPRANEDVTLTIQVEASVQAVEVLIKRDGQVVQSINATRKGSGTFEVKFNPGEGDHRIDVTARDSAGNTKLAEGAVVFSAKPGSPFGVPAAPIPLLLVALVAMALLARRRRA